MITGTSHFRSRAEAENYYTPYVTDVPRRQRDEAARALVSSKLKQGEINIGKPSLKPGESLLFNAEEGRYFIQS